MKVKQRFAQVAVAAKQAGPDFKKGEHTMKIKTSIKAGPGINPVQHSE